jgi:hypothetical protein
MRLRGQLLKVCGLSDNDRQAMLALMERHYADVCPERFAADLKEKDWVIALYDRAQELQGFSTQTVFDVPMNGRSVRVLFSGDTIVDRGHWGDPALSHVWGRLAVDLIDAADGHELYWFLISQGFRTYRFLPVFFQEYYPRYDQETPAPIRQLIDALALKRFHRAYDSASGTVFADGHQYRLRESLSAVPSERLSDPHVEFFLRANPHHARGDELCCLAPLTRENFTPAAWRVINASSERRETQRCRLPVG